MTVRTWGKARPRHAGRANKMPGGVADSCRETFATFCAATSQHIATANRGHPVTEAMTALADKFARLVGAFHDCHSIAFEPQSRPASAAGSRKNWFGSSPSTGLDTDDRYTVLII